MVTFNTLEGQAITGVRVFTNQRTFVCLVVTIDPDPTNINLAVMSQLRKGEVITRVENGPIPALPFAVITRGVE